VKHLEAAIFDWAGTTIDWGSMAPVRALTSLFAHRGIQLTDPDIRRDMGLFKKDHIRRILSFPHADAEWQKLKGRKANEDDIEDFFTEFMSLQMQVLDEHSQVIAGVATLANRLRDHGLKLGATTGYTRPMLELLLARAAEQDYRPDLSLCPDDVGGGRPYPWMCLRLALNFRLSSTAAAVKIGDTVSDIQEGLNAGMWTVGVTATGNEVGLTESQLAALSIAEHDCRLDQASNKLKAAGAHYVIPSVAQLEPILEQIDRRLREGERP
jgi:phosphonoacetaldehyde hydrolase